MLWLIMMLAAAPVTVQQSPPKAGTERMLVTTAIRRGAVASEGSKALHRAERTRILREKQLTGEDVEITVFDFE